MDAFIHQLLAGLATGGIYATVALALVMIYQATHHINFAQGEMAMFSTFIAWALLQAGLPYWWAFLATVALSSDGKGPGVVVGMGVNLDHRGAAPVDTATDLAEWIGADAVPAPRDLAVELRDAVVAAVDRFAAGVAGQTAAVDGRHPAVAAVADRLSTLGRAVRAELPGGGVLEGTAVGLGPGGTLRVRHVTPDHGTIETEVSAGDVAHLRGDVHRGA